MRFLMPLIIIGIAITGFFVFTNPIYKDISSIRDQISSYNQALDNSKALENERDKLTNKYNSFDPNNLKKLQVMLPDNVDNIRLILEIEKIATPYGMVLKNVKYDTQSKDTSASAPTTTSATIGGVVPGSVAGSVASTSSATGNYGTWNLSFSTQGTYTNFVSFVKDLERNLRIVDISSVDFSSDTGAGASPALSSIYTYNFKIQTYWLKN